MSDELVSREPEIRSADLMRSPREAAFREILQVISRSRSDEKPVFDAIMENAARLCDAPMASLNIVNEARTHLTIKAHWGPPLKHFRAGVSQVPLDSQNLAARAVRERRPLHLKDLADDDLYRQGDPTRVAMVDQEGGRSILIVPLIGGQEAIGCITLFRREVKPFTDSHIDLVTTFAEQAVIAIENVRQFRELQTRLEREEATREILEVISRSRDDEQPVFDAILENAARLCGAPMASLSIVNEARTYLTMVAHWGTPLRHYQPGVSQLALDGRQLVARAISEIRTFHQPDLADDDLYREGHPERRALVEREGVRTFLVVPLVSGDIGIGTIALYRRTVSPFSKDQIALVETFAAQAVIAIENVRQFRELQDRSEEVRAQAEELRSLNAELESRVARQVGELERMGRLKRFLSPQVADAVISSGDDRLLASHRALIAILFCDIRGFTAFCEQAEPEEAIEVLQAYHEAMGELIRSHAAGVDHRTGDGIMVIFNDPLPCDDPAGSALDLALAMRERMAGLCAGWRRLGHRLGHGIGISLGYATVGMVGSEGRYDYTASGTAVNLAARLCEEAGDGEILLSPRAYAALEDRVNAEPAGAFSLKGISAPVEVMRVRQVAHLASAGPD